MTNWAEVMRANKEKIVEAIIQAKKEAEGTMSGGHVAVEIDRAGDVWVGGLVSCGSQSQSSWSGETFEIVHVQSWELDICEHEIIEDFPELNAEYESQKEDGYETEYEFMQEKHPAIYKEWLDEARQNELDNFGAAEILEHYIAEYEQYAEGGN